METNILFININGYSMLIVKTAMNTSFVVWSNSNHLRQNDLTSSMCVNTVSTHWTTSSDRMVPLPIQEFLESSTIHGFAHISAAGDGKLVFSIKSQGTWSFRLQNKTMTPYKKKLSMSSAEDFCVSQYEHFVRQGTCSRNALLLWMDATAALHFKTASRKCWKDVPL